MRLQDLREEKFALQHWRSLRPFYCLLCPEYIWSEMRNNLIEEVREELAAARSGKFEYPTYFTYPSAEQMHTIHDQVHGLMMSEIREVVGYRVAVALSMLAAMIRLECEGPASDLFKTCFQVLWGEFSLHGYHRGYRTSEVRSKIVSLLGSNNVLGLVADKTWQEKMLAYFQTETHDWSGEPLRDFCGGAIRILGGEPKDRERDVITRGHLGLDSASREEILGLCRGLYWEQGEPEEDVYMPSVMLSSARRGDGDPPSDIYQLPYHLVKVSCGSLLTFEVGDEVSLFERTALHFLISLHLRTVLVAALGVDRSFTVEEAVRRCGLDGYAVRMAVGQVIKVGLCEFDRYRGTSWDHPEQEYLLSPDARVLR